jgi:hypothetical protein
MRGAAAHAATALSANHTVKLPRRRKPASQAGQSVTLCCCRGMWWRRSWFSLNGKAKIPRSGKRDLSYAGPVRIANGESMHRADPGLYPPGVTALTTVAMIGLTRVFA